MIQYGEHFHYHSFQSSTTASSCLIVLKDWAVSDHPGGESMQSLLKTSLALQKSLLHLSAYTSQHTYLSLCISSYLVYSKNHNIPHVDYYFCYVFILSQLSLFRDIRSRNKKKKKILITHTTIVRNQRDLTLATPTISISTNESTNHT